MRLSVFAATVFLLAAGGCQTAPDQTYSVFFETWSAKLDQQSDTLIKAAAVYAAEHPAEPIEVVGYADPIGSAAANVDVSATRAQVVRDAMIARGIPAARITTRAYGAKEPKWTLQEARRVEIRVGGGGILPQ